MIEVTSIERRTRMSTSEQDCKDRTHGCYSFWEHLRHVQKVEAIEQAERTE